jgi:predicted ribosome quality control (RQC) complex YloA/Tae2 family protein
VIGGERLAWLVAPATGEPEGAGKTREFQVRDLPPPEGREEATFNERVEAWYAARGGELSRERLLETARERFEKRFSLLETRIAALEERAAKFRNADRTRELGDLIMANLGALPAGKHLVALDFFRGGEIHIPIDTTKSLVANATNYYERAKKETSGLGEVEEERRRWQAELAAERAELARIEGLRDALHIAKALDKGGTTRKERERKYPGLSLVLGEWTILVGRSAKENDELLRRHVRGSDLWLHARDYSGSYVFVKSRPGKSIPLEVLLDAGSLAIYYSKGREAGEGDLYYTWVKYLRRAKDGPKGLVIPTQEKNLFVRVNEARIRELRTLMGNEGD